MTSDGISQQDWDGVKELALQIVNATSSKADFLRKRITNKLLVELTRLQGKYGPLPSVLATRADYLQGTKRRISLLQKAWQRAAEMSDNANRTFVASSLAELLIDELHDIVRGEKWLDNLAAALELHWDDGEYKLYKQLQTRVNAIRRPGGRVKQRRRAAKTPS